LFFGLSVPLVALALACFGFGPEQGRRNWRQLAASLAYDLIDVSIF